MLPAPWGECWLPAPTAMPGTTGPIWGPHGSRQAATTGPVVTRPLLSSAERHQGQGGHQDREGGQDEVVMWAGGSRQSGAAGG